MNKYPKPIRVDKYQRHISGNRNEIDIISVDRNEIDINVDRNESHISRNKYPKPIRIDKYQRHIRVDSN